MKTVILGHAGADFDCVASMAGLSRLYAGAVPVLPGSLEPNVEEFLRLYEGRFRFVRMPAPVLLKEDIETVVIADTIVASRLGEYKEVLSLPGIRLVAYDHHEPNSASLAHIDEGHIRKCGATASLVTAALRERLVPVNPDEATLLALGIYEDTGSLLFPETTAFDVEQAAYLLKAGASLSMVARYVTTYLVPDQQTALENALSNAQVRTVAGAQIAFSIVHAERNVGNLSVIVHRLAQIIKAEALFLIYQTPQSLYVLGRSDRLLNVAELLAPLGGAGRIHAAASILRDGTSAETAQEHIISAIAARRTQWRQVVRDIMTPHPATVSQDRVAEEALQIMVNLGFSVLPVERDGQVVGVVAKKALEKTSLMRLQQKPVHYFLNTRIPAVPLTATVEELIQAFGTYNTGLLLVMEQEHLLGVVSRSDVLRYLNSTAHPQSVVGATGGRVIARSDLDRLGGSDTAAILATIGQIGDAEENRAYLVGGSVRDVLLGRPPNDVDIVTEKDVSGVAAAVAASFGTNVISYGRFMTHKVRIRGREYDFAAARLEYYDFPGSLPTVAPATLIKDLLRRDFTVNALAMSLSESDFGTIIDATGGLKDLDARIIRMTYADSFIEDPARILRAVAAQTRLSFILEDGTRDKAREALELGLLNVRRNRRAQDEFKELLSGGTGVACITALCSLGCGLIGLPLVPPRAARLRLLSALGDARKPVMNGLNAPLWVAPLLVWLGNISSGAVQEVLKDFGLSDRLAAAFHSWQRRERGMRRLLEQGSSKVSAIAAKLEGIPLPVLSILEAHLAGLETSGPHDLLLTVLARMDKPRLVSGKDVVILGIPEGRRVGMLLDQVRRLQLDGIIGSREEAVAYLCASKG
ncbi:MAG: CBS domain-containing protein [Caldiserica bacterium]|nr:CBS domain-containing protein [Caldisericota bacterium]